LQYPCGSMLKIDLVPYVKRKLEPAILGWKNPYLPILEDIGRFEGLKDHFIPQQMDLPKEIGVPITFFLDLGHQGSVLKNSHFIGLEIPKFVIAPHIDSPAVGIHLYGTNVLGTGN